MMKKIKVLLVNMGISVVTIFLLLTIVEMLLRMFSPQDLSGTWRTTSKNGYMLNRASWTAKHSLNDRKVIYRFNEWHLRGDRIKHNQYKILSLGDSFTFGWLLEENKTYVGLLQDYCNHNFGANKIQILNGGAGGWGLADFLDYLIEFGDKVKPNMIILFFNSDDIGRSINRHKFHNPSSKLQKAKIVFNNSRSYLWLLEHSHLAQWVRQRLVNLSLQPIAEKERKEKEEGKEENVIIPKTVLSAEDMAAAIEMGEHLFLTIDRWCSERNIPFIVLTTGWHFDLYQKEHSTNVEALFIQDNHLFFSKNDIPFYELTPAIIKDIGGDIQKYTIINDHHPNEKGAQLIAKHSWDKLYPIIEDYYKKEQ